MKLVKNKIKRIANIEIFRYLFVSGISFIIDIAIFNFLIYSLEMLTRSLSIIISAVLARIISSFINYLLNRNIVFNKNEVNKIDKKSLIQYYLLVIIQLCISFSLTIIIDNIFKINVTIIKIIVDIIIFLVNYLVQKLIIFKK